MYQGIYAKFLKSSASAGCLLSLEILEIFWNLIDAPEKCTALQLCLYNTCEENLNKNNSKIYEHVQHMWPSLFALHKF